MWLTGHFAVALIICLPLLLLLKEQRGLGLVYVAFFSVLPDFLHSGALRMASHSLLGWAIMLSAVLALLIIAFRLRPALLAIAALASFAHLLGDLYIGSIFPFYPFDPNYVVLHNLNTLFALRAEVLFIILAAVMLIVLLRPWTTLKGVRNYSPSQRRNLLVLMLPFGLMTLAEGAYYFLFFFRNQPGIVAGVILLAFLGLIAFSFIVTLLALLPSAAREYDRCAQRQLY
ncbi:hypothetical protein [Methanomassiliicoccus luminyensis]|uniref:hypothetical protein n=1 Tax=Methanomassiliicoccus luminyensis TaxID=1080712 RepID=UPI00047516CB|nr:hypothetical protein [Methanomassiliicoccus luminyensis]